MKLTLKEIDTIVSVQQKIDAILIAACNRNGMINSADCNEPILNALYRITADCEEIIEQNDLLINNL